MGPVASAGSKPAGSWRSAIPGVVALRSLYDLRLIVMAVLSSSVGFYILARWVFGQPDYPPFRVPDCTDSCSCALLGTLRLARRTYHEMRPSRRGKKVLGS